MAMKWDRSEALPACYRKRFCNAYGTSMVRSLPAKMKFGRRRPFMNFAAVCESAVMMIGRAIVASQLT